MAPNGWRQTTIEAIKANTATAIAIGPFGSRMKSDRYVPAGIPVLRGNNISDTRQLAGDFVYVSPETADELSGSNVVADDLFFPHRGAIGQVGIVPRNGEGRYILSTSLMKLTCNTRIVDPRFVFYFFRSPEGRHELLKYASTVGTPGIGQPLTSLRSMAITLPSLSEQQAIGDILGALDDKIEVNRRMNETLEATARTLFKSWFIDFDPVRAKAGGLDLGLPKRIADLFPARLVTSELGDIPEGWKFRSFASTVEIISGGTPKTSVPAYWDGDIPWFSIVDAPTGTDVWVVDTEKKITLAGVENSSTRILPVGTTIISARGTIGRVALVGVPMAMNQSCYGIRGKVGPHDLFTYFSMQELVADLQQYADGSVFDTITRDMLAGISVVVPPKTVVETFEKIASPILERVRQAILNTRIIATIRNTLLPKLISGEMRIGGGDVVNGDTG
jgi:type I restriction enzyme, S subunit